MLYYVYSSICMLFVIPTPIWNKEDITLRALRLFNELSIFFCEDTRTTMKLMKMYDIDIRNKRFHSLTSFTSKWQFDQYLLMLQEGDCGIVSEAGMPWLSDPWKHLIKLCRERNIKMEVLPGANALLPGVIAAYVDTSRFVYMWFPPLKKWRQTFFKKLLSYDIPVFIYESVHRVEKTLKQIQNLWYDWEVFLSREISKMYEQHAHWSIEEILTSIENKSIVLKGEFVLWFSPIWISN